MVHPVLSSTDMVHLVLSSTHPVLSSTDMVHPVLSSTNNVVHLVLSSTDVVCHYIQLHQQHCIATYQFWLSKLKTFICHVNFTHTAS